MESGGQTNWPPDITIPSKLPNFYLWHWSWIHFSLLTSKHNRYGTFTILPGHLAEFQIDFYTYRVIDRVGQRLMDQQVRTDLLEHCSVMKQAKTFKWNFGSLYGESRLSTYSYDVTGFVYGCLFVCDWHRQMVFVSSGALMAVVHHSACVSRRCRDKRSPTQVNDQSLQRKWRCMSFESVSPALK